ncbi:AAA family ATPase [Rhodococcus sp. NPDC127530]|uniref:AAA family ATPase n=1 Tax=unclassified Rhodococcus (in: high G+C Gram-positive bacteria) TaxID=192944 RepID=UPI0036263D8A
MTAPPTEETPDGIADDEIGFTGPPLAAVDALNAAEEDEIRNNATLTRYPAVDIAALMASPPEPPNWLEEGVIARGVYYGLTAAAKTGKSILAYWLVGHWALGRSALDHTRTFDPLTVLYIDFENGALWLHTQLTNMRFPATIGDTLKVVQFPTLEPMNTPRGADALHRLLDAYKPDVLVIDTVSRTVVGEENSSTPWLDFYRLAITPIRDQRPDLTIIRLDHTGKDEARGARGSSAKMSDLDTHWVLTTEDRDRNALTLTLERSRMAFHADRINLRRTDGPLGHVLRAGKTGAGAIEWGGIHAVGTEVDTINAGLDALGADNTISNAEAKKLLKDNGKPANSNLIASALRHRKDRDITPAGDTPKALE